MIIKNKKILLYFTSLAIVALSTLIIAVVFFPTLFAVFSGIDVTYFNKKIETQPIVSKGLSWGVQIDSTPYEEKRGNFFTISGILSKRYLEKNKLWLRILTKNGLLDIYIGISGSAGGIVDALTEEENKVVVNLGKGIEILEYQKFLDKIDAHKNKPIVVTITAHNETEKQRNYYKYILANICKDDLCSEDLNNRSASVVSDLQVLNTLVSSKNFVYRKISLPYSQIIL